jgi:hypothetical protein
MYRSFAAMWEGWTKNLYVLFSGTLKHSLGALLTPLIVDWISCFALLVLLIVPGLASLKGEIAPGLLAAIVISLVVITYEQVTYRSALRLLGFSSAVAKYVFIGVPLFSLLLLNSAWAHHQGRVRWKGREYGPGHEKMGDK